MIGGIILFIIIVGFAICARFGWRPSKPENIPWKWIRYVVGAIVLVVALLYAKNWYVERDEAKKVEKAQADSAKVAQHRQNTPAPQQDWTFETYEQIQKKGLRVYLYPGWKSFPTGGLIDIKTPDGTIVRNYPGIEVTENAPPSLLRSIEQKGWYTFYPNPLGSERGVIIFNCWICQQGP